MPLIVHLLTIYETTLEWIQIYVTSFNFFYKIQQTISKKTPRRKEKRMAHNLAFLSMLLVLAVGTVEMKGTRKAPVLHVTSPMIRANSGLPYFVILREVRRFPSSTWSRMRNMRLKVKKHKHSTSLRFFTYEGGWVRERCCLRSGPK